MVTWMLAVVALLLHNKDPVKPEAVKSELPSQLFVTPTVGAAGVFLGAGVTELLALLVQPFTVWVTVRAAVEVTVRGLPLPPSLQVSVPVNPEAVTVDVPLQLSCTSNTGATGLFFGAAVAASLA